MKRDSVLARETAALLFEKGSDLAFILSEQGIIIDSNQAARAFSGRPLVGERFQDMWTKDQEQPDFSGLIGNTDNGEQLIQLNDASRLPQSFYFSFKRLDYDRIFVFGRIDIKELEYVREELFSLTQDLSNLSRELHKKNAELQSALRHVKQLQGCLPICMHCHRIRNKKALWHKLETYIQHHSEATFSHGICPECVEKYYPEETE